jgi:prophage regulatory protein
MAPSENCGREVDRYLRQSQIVGKLLPFSASTLWRKVRSGTFPAPVKLGPSITAWREREIVEWLKSHHEAIR